MILFCSPVEARYRLETVAKAQDNSEGEHHDFCADTNASQNRVGNISGDVIEQNRGNHCQTGSKHGGRSYADNSENDVL